MIYSLPDSIRIQNKYFFNCFPLHPTFFPGLVTLPNLFLYLCVKSLFWVAPCLLLASLTWISGFSAQYWRLLACFLLLKLFSILSWFFSAFLKLISLTGKSTECRDGKAEERQSGRVNYLHGQHILVSIIKNQRAFLNQKLLLFCRKAPNYNPGSQILNYF